MAIRRDIPCKPVFGLENIVESLAERVHERTQPLGVDGLRECGPSRIIFRFIGIGSLGLVAALPPDGRVVLPRIDRQVGQGEIGARIGVRVEGRTVFPRRLQRLRARLDGGMRLRIRTRPEEGTDAAEVDEGVALGRSAVGVAVVVRVEPAIPTGIRAQRVRVEVHAQEDKRERLGVIRGVAVGRVRHASGSRDGCARSPASRPLVRKWVYGSVSPPANCGAVFR